MGHFWAALRIISSDGIELMEVKGRCQGSITPSPRGDPGFVIAQFWRATTTVARSMR